MADAWPWLILVVAEVAFLVAYFGAPAPIDRVLGPVWQALKTILIPTRWRRG